MSIALVALFGLLADGTAVCTEEMLGNGQCDRGCMAGSAQADREQSLCDQFCPPLCEKSRLGDGNCDAACNSWQCNYDHGDCSYCSPQCFRGSLRNSICDPPCNVPLCSYDGGDCSSVTHPLEVFVRAGGPAGGNGEQTDPFVDLSYAIGQLWLPNNRIWLMDSIYSIGHSLWFPQELYETTLIAPLACRDVDECEEFAVWELTNGRFTVAVSHELTLRNVRIRGGFPLAEGCVTEMCRYCPKVSYSDTEKTWVDDRGHSVDIEAIAPQTLCDGFKDDSIFVVSLTGKLYLSSVHFEDIRHQPHSLISTTCGQLFLTDTHFYNCMSYPLGLAGGLIQMESLSQYTPYYCGRLKFLSGSVTLLNNGYEYAPDSLFSGFLFIDSAMEVVIVDVNFAYNFLPVGSETNGQRAALISLRRFRQISFQRLLFEFNVLLGSVAVLVESDLTVPVVAEGGVAVEQGTVAMALREVEFRENLGALLHSYYKGDPQNLQFSLLTLTDNAISDSDSLIDLLQQTTDIAQTVDFNSSLPDGSWVIVPRRIVSLTDSVFDGNSAAKIISLYKVGLVDVRNVTVSRNNLDESRLITAVVAGFSQHPNVYFSETARLPTATFQCDGIFLADSGLTLHISDLLIEENHCSGESPGLHLSGLNYSFSLSNSSFLSNTGEGALRLETAGEVSIRNATFAGNSNRKSKVSPCLHLEPSLPNSVSVSDCGFVSNSGLMGTAIFAIGVGNLTLSSVAVRGNTAKGNCAGLLVSPPPSQRSVFQLSNSEFQSNTATVSGPVTVTDVGGLLIGTTDFSIHIAVANSTFSENHSEYDGGGLVIGEFILISQESLIENCRFHSNGSNKGGGILLSFATGTLEIALSRLESNQASEGAAIFAGPGSSTADSPAAILIRDSYVGSQSGTAVSIQTEADAHITSLRNVFENNENGVLSMSGGQYFDSDSVYSTNFGEEFAVGFFHESAQVHFINLTARENASGSNAGVFFITELSQIHCDSCEFSSNFAELEAGVIYIEGGGHFEATNSDFVRNSAGGIGSVFYTLLGSISLSACEIAENVSAQYGAIVFVQSNVRISACEFRNNTSAVRSPGLSLSTSVLNISDSHFAGQKASRGSFVSAADQCEVRITNCSFLAGTASIQGGALYVTQDSMLSFTDSQIADCSSKSGGGIYINGGGSASIVRSTFTSNRGGCLFTFQTNLTVSQSEFSLFSEGAIHGYQLLLVSIEDSVFRDGKGTYGGGVYCVGCEVGTVVRSVFERLTADSGGGLYVAAEGSEGANNHFEVQDNYLRSNEALAGAGGYFDSVDLLFTNNSLINNTAKTGGVNRNGTGEGGGLRISCDSVSFCNVSIAANRFLSNSAAMEGGGMAWRSVVPVSSDNFYEKNASPYGANRASWPILLGPALSNRTFAGFSSISDSVPVAYIQENYKSGSEFEDGFLFGLFDHEMTIVTSDNSSVIEAVAEENRNMTIAGNIKAVAKAGMFILSGFTLTGPPGSTHLYKIAVNSISESTKVRTNDPADYVAVVGVAVTFRLCESGESEQSFACVQCPKETFSFSPETPCQTCPSHAVCYGGDLIVPAAGYWRPNTQKPTILPCLLEEACIGSPAPPEASPRGLCETGFEGNLCQSCSEGYSRNGRNGCSKCPSLGKNVVITCVIAVIACSVLVILVWISIRSATHLQSSFSIYIKIFLNYLQMVVVAASLDLNWPSFVQLFLQGQDKAGSVGDQLFSVDCILQGSQNRSEMIYAKSVMMSALPAALFVLSAVCWGAIRLMWSLENFHQKLLATLVMVLFLLLPTIAKSMLSPFACMEIDSGELWLLYDLALPCWSQAHYRLISTVLVPSIGLWVVALPATALFTLIRSRKTLYSPAVRRVFSFLYKGYKPEQYYWEFVVMYRKILMVCSAVFLSNVSIRTQALSIFAILLVSLLIQMQIAPFSISSLNTLEIKSIFVSALTIYLGLYYESTELDFVLKVALFVALIIMNAYFLVSWLRAISPVLFSIIKKNFGCFFRPKRYQVASLSISPGKHPDMTSSQVDLYSSTGQRNDGTVSQSKDFSISSEQGHPPNTSVLPAEREYTNPNELPVIYSLGDEA